MFYPSCMTITAHASEYDEKRFILEEISNLFSVLTVNKNKRCHFIDFDDVLFRFLFLALVVLLLLLPLLSFVSLSSLFFRLVFIL